ncbi:PHB depolymerase family esterase [Paracoccus sp. (in: a-proteobacteria)]|uniref:extracellular catalytic domain type 1 short-chain-length polyhydroxyalkanoate depolymerase n=1 Tax=Paracoccus sp. TaxID=267 RepID=UPI0035B2306F
MTSLFKRMIGSARRTMKRRPLAAVLAAPGLSGQKQKPAKGPKASPLRRDATPPAVSRPARPAPGTFISDTFACPEGALDYRFYTPAGSVRRRMPMVVMLHGCSQTAMDFALGTGMNRLADEFGVLVLYPQQAPQANVGRCWNWHDPRHQARGRGEPAVIAALTRYAMALGRANPARIYIAGISAGGTAAAIIGAAYPDLFAAVGSHSGLARGNIRSLRAAVSAMRGRHGTQPTGRLPRQLPTIVFHGDSDRVVHPSNAAGFLRNLERSHSAPLLCTTRSGRSPGGRDFTQRVYAGRGGKALLEEWTIHGSGHGWSGGRALGSHTDPAGPDASREMLRFFLSHRRD